MDDDDDGFDGNVAASGGADNMPSKRIFQAAEPPTQVTEQTRENWRGILLAQQGAFEALKKSRLHDSMLCDFLKVEIVKGWSSPIVTATEKWQKATTENPSSHNLGPLFPYPYKPMIRCALKILKHGANADLAAKVGMAAIQGIEEHLSGLKDTDDVHDFVSHCLGKESYSGDLHVIEIAFRAAPEAQLLRKVLMNTFTAMGATRMVGPPPPGETERELKKSIAELKQKLGIGKREKKKT